MSYSLRPFLELQIPDPPMPGPTEHRSLQKNMDKEGGFAKTLAERFPFGMIAKEEAPALKFNWGEENFNFLEDMLQTNERMHEQYLDWSTKLDLEKRIRFRDIQKDLEEQWFFYLQDHHRFLLDIEKNRDQLTKEWAVKLLFDRVGDRFFENREFFMTKIIQAQDIRKEERRMFDEQIRKNPNDTRLAFPDRLDKFEVVAKKNGQREDMFWDLRDKFFVNEARFIMEHDAKRVAEIEQNAKIYAHQTHYEHVLVDKRPDHAEYGWEPIERMRIGKIEPGTVIADKYQGDIKK